MKRSTFTLLFLALASFTLSLGASPGIPPTQGASGTSIDVKSFVLDATTKSSDEAAVLTSLTAGRTGARPAAQVQRMIAERAASWRAAYPLVSSMFFDPSSGEVVLNVRGSDADAKAAQKGLQQLAAADSLKFRAIAVGAAQPTSIARCLCSEIDSNGQKIKKNG